MIKPDLVKRNWLNRMTTRFNFYIVLLLACCISSGIVVSDQSKAPGEAIEYRQPSGAEGLDTYSENKVNEKQSVTYASIIPGVWQQATMMQAPPVAPFWWSAWFFILLTILVSSILIYLYVEHGRKVISVREENNKLKEENARLEDELAERTSDIESSIKQLKKAEAELVEKSHKAGMSEIAAGVLHNVANVLSSVNSSNTFIKDTAKNSNVDGLIKANQMLRENIDHIDKFIFEDPKGKKLLKYYLKLEEPLKKERDDIVSQSERLDQKIGIINDVIVAQQSHAGSAKNTSETLLSEIVDITLSLQDDLDEFDNLNIIKDLNTTTPVIAERSKLIHVLLNFIKNAAESMDENRADNKNLTIKSWEDSYKVYLSVTDNGSGIKDENLDKIFAHSFTTKKKGHGFGLHSSANYMKEMGGEIEVSSDGNGTTFTLVFPILREPKPSQTY